MDRWYLFTASANGILLGLIGTWELTKACRIVSEPRKIFMWWRKCRSRGHSPTRKVLLLISQQYWGWISGPCACKAIAGPLGHTQLFLAFLCYSHKCVCSVAWAGALTVQCCPTSTVEGFLVSPGQLVPQWTVTFLAFILHLLLLFNIHYFIISLNIFPFIWNKPAVFTSPTKQKIFTSILFPCCFKKASQAYSLSPAIKHQCGPIFKPLQFSRLLESEGFYFFKTFTSFSLCICLYMC